jgi:hypothetical protein
LGVACGLAIVVLGVLVAALVTRSGRHRLTTEEYEAAVSRWEKNGPASYNLDLEVSGKRPGKIHVEVRDGQVTHMTRDGVEPAQERTWYYWTVPGQFDTIAEELEMARDPRASFRTSEATEMVIWAEFDRKYGYPTKYERIVLGADFETGWKVTRFELLGERKTGKK